MRMQRVFREVLEDDLLQLSPDDSEATLPAWDSFAQVKLIIGLEEEFDVKFSIDEVAETKKVDGLRKLIERKTAASA
jgi:acyl carrier protein